MKQFLLLFGFLIGGLLTAAAQDKIVKIDTSIIEAKVLEITPEVVRYKRFSNPEGPTYLLPVGEIHYIQYANGEKEFFTLPAKDAAPAAPAPVVAPAPEVAPVTTPEVRYTRKEYAVGEYYNENGLQGVVCVLSEDKQHGLLISMDELYLPWSLFRKPDYRLTGVSDRAEGSVNMRTVEQYIAKNGCSWDDFPAFKWCRDKGPGWYLPAIDEMLQIGHNYNGGSRVQNNRQARNKFNDALKNNAGERMDRMVYYFTSTEIDEKNAYTTHMAIDPPYVIEIPKYNKFLVRAVHKF